MARTGLVVINKGLAKKYLALAKAVPSIRDTAMNTLAEGAKGDFKKTVATWTNPPSFAVVRRSRSWTVATDDMRFVWTDKGTRPHIIAPRNKSRLVFQANYAAKTVPGRIASRAGGASGSFVFTSKPVHHPGTRARNFTAVIFSKWQARVLKVTRTALRNGIESVGL